MEIVVRAVTYFADSRQDFREEYWNGLRILDEASEIIRELGFNVFTKRISMYKLSRSDILKLPSLASRDVLVSTGYINPRSLHVDDFKYLTNSGVYTPILPRLDDFTRDEAVNFSRIIHSVAEENPVNATRVSIGFHSESFMTPYFPDSSSRGFKSIGLAFLYTEALKAGSLNSISAHIERVFKEFEVIASSLEVKLGLPVFIDYSLSPWMEMSVAGLLESLGFKVTEPGFNYALYTVNKLIAEYSNHSRAIGFNEVMLPYAEDSVLVEYGGSGLLKARDFLRYASTCVAGVDMIIVPSNIEKLAGLIMDSYSLSMVKSRPLSLRVIPVNKEPGEKVELGKFGESFVIGY